MAVPRRGVLFLCLSFFACLAAAQNVRFVVGFTPGGPSDVLARIVGRKMSEILGKTFVIENKPGAGGNIAAEFVSHATPDGYTLLMGNNSILATNEALYKSLKYKPEEFLPITSVGTSWLCRTGSPAYASFPPAAGCTWSESSAMVCSSPRYSKTSETPFTGRVENWAPAGIVTSGEPPAAGGLNVSVSSAEADTGGASS